MKKLILGTVLLIGLFNSSTVSAEDTFEIGLGVGICSHSHQKYTAICNQDHVEHLYGKIYLYRYRDLDFSYQLHHFSSLEWSDVTKNTEKQTGEFNYQGIYVSYRW